MGSVAFEKYLSEERKTEIAEAAFREVCEDTFRTDAERIFSNAAYRAVWKVVDESFDGKAAQLVANKLPAIIEKLTAFSVFRCEEHGRRKSVGQQALDKAVQNNAALIDAKIASLVQAMETEQLVDAVLGENFKLSFVRE